MIILLALFGEVTALSITGTGESRLSALKENIREKGFAENLLKEYIFIVKNDSIDIAVEEIFIKKLKPSVEKSIALALLKFKTADFENAYSLLIELLPAVPKYYLYYNLLAKSARITGKENHLIERAKKITEANFSNYLLGLCFYDLSEFDKAKEYFEKAIKDDPASYEAYYFLSYSMRNLGDYDTAFKLLNKTESLFRVGNPFAAKVKVAKGSLYYLSGNYTKAKDLYTLGLRFANKFSFTTEKIKALINLAILADEEGNIKAARRKFHEALLLAERINDLELKALASSELAVSYTYTNELIDARKTYLKSFKALEKLNYNSRLALTANNIGNLLVSEANYVRAMEYYDFGLEYAGDNVRTRMLLLRGLGDVYTNLANYSRAAEYYSQAKRMAKEIKDVSGEAEVNIGLGILYYNLNQLEKALEVLQEAERKLSEELNPFIAMDVYQKMGIVYSTLKNEKEADTYLKKALSLSEQYGDIYNEILAKTFLIYLRLNSRNSGKINLELKKLIDETKEYGLTQLTGLQYLMLSEYYRKSGDKRKIISNLKMVIRYASEVNDFNLLIEANYRSGEIEEEKGNKILAEKYYLKAIDLIDNVSHYLFSKSDIQIKFFSNYSDIYDALIELYLEEDRIEEAFITIEKSRSRNTLYSISQIKLEKKVGDKKLLDKYYDLEWKVNTLGKTDDSSNPLTMELNALRKEIFAKYPDVILSPKKWKDFNLADIRSQLDDREYLITYYIMENSTKYFVINKTKFYDGTLPVNRDQMLKMISNVSPYYNPEFSEKEIYINKDLFAFNSEASYRLFSAIMKPVIDGIPINSNIIFSLPYEMISIPMEFLVTNFSKELGAYNYKRNKYLINDYAVSYVPSAIIWIELRDKKFLSNGEPLLLGDPVFNTSDEYAVRRGIDENIDLYSRSMVMAPLEYSGEEIKSIKDLLGVGKVYLAEEATESKFKKNSLNSSLIHLSTHSILYKNNPVILFSRTDESDDGFLEVGEIANMELNSDLVVLSSCKSGTGLIDKAEGILGMAKAFFGAGAGSIIVSLWDVNDRMTAKLMTYFYSFLSEGYDKSDALRKAKIEFIKNDSPNPYYWAAFTLTGNIKPFNVSTRNFSYRFYIFLAATVMLIYILYLYIRKVRVYKNLDGRNEQV